MAVEEWAVAQMPNDAMERLRVVRLIGAGKRFATVEFVRRQRIAVCLVQGVFPTEDAAMKARNAAASACPWTLVTAKSAIKASAGYRSLEIA